MHPRLSCFNERPRPTYTPRHSFHGLAIESTFNCVSFLPCAVIHTRLPGKDRLLESSIAINFIGKSILIEIQLDVSKDE